jgi:inner membrane transporter RhtA
MSRPEPTPLPPSQVLTTPFTADSIPPWAYLLASIISVQIGGALATTLFSTLGPNTVVFIRCLLASIMFFALWRPRLRGYSARAWVYVTIFGASIAGMMVLYYNAIARIPIGVTVAIAFIGPLGVAVLFSRKAIDLLWVALAAAGILLLSPINNTGLDPLGVALAVASGLIWAVYILLGRRIGQFFPGNSGIAVAMGIAAVVSAFFGYSNAALALTRPDLLIGVVAVALLASAIPFALQYQALKRLPSRVYGILSSIEPVIAALVAFIFVSQEITPTQLAGIVLVTVAAVATSRSASQQTPS